MSLLFGDELTEWRLPESSLPVTEEKGANLVGAAHVVDHVRELIRRAELAVEHVGDLNASLQSQTSGFLKNV